MQADLPALPDSATPARLSPVRLLASWRRSKDYGVPLESVEPVFTGTHDEESLFFECGREVLSDSTRPSRTSRSPSC